MGFHSSYKLYLYLKLDIWPPLISKFLWCNTFSSSFCSSSYESCRPSFQMQFHTEERTNTNCWKVNLAASGSAFDKYPNIWWTSRQHIAREGQEGCAGLSFSRCGVTAVWDGVCLKPSICWAASCFLKKVVDLDFSHISVQHKVLLLGWGWGGWAGWLKWKISCWN